MDVTIRGITFPDIDLTDANIVETWDAGIESIQAMKRPREGDVKGSAAFIRELCDTLRDWFDDILGDGAGDSVLPRDSMKEALVAYRELIEAQKQANNEVNAILAEFSIDAAEASPLPVSRKQRRAQKRLNQRNKQKRSAPADAYSPERLEQ